MAQKLLSDEQWREIIQTCRSSGLSDHRWCTENGVAPSTFYKYASKLRLQACKVSAAKPLSFPDPHEVVQVSLNDTSSTVVEHNTPYTTGSPAISLNIKGIHMEIHNHADPLLLTNTLQALKNIC